MAGAMGIMMAAMRGTNMVPQSDGSVIGDMTSNGGLAGAFNGTTAQNAATSARSGGSTPRGHVGKDWGANQSKIITRFTVYSPTNAGGFGPVNENTRIRLKGSNSVPAAWDGSGFGGTQLHTADLTAPGNSYTHDVTSGITTTTAYRYHWVEIILLSAANEAYCAEAQFYVPS